MGRQNVPRDQWLEMGHECPRCGEQVTEADVYSWRPVPDDPKLLPDKISSRRDWSPGFKSIQVLVTPLPRPMELQREILRIRPSIQERVEDVRSPIQQQAPTAREERVWLKVVGDSPALDIESSVGRAAGIKPA